MTPPTRTKKAGKLRWTLTIPYRPCVYLFTARDAARDHQRNYGGEIRRVRLTEIKPKRKGRK